MSDITIREVLQGLGFTALIFIGMYSLFVLSGPAVQ